MKDETYLFHQTPPELAKKLIAEVDLVREEDKEAKRNANIESSVSSIGSEIYTKKGWGDIKSLNNIKSL